MKRKILSLLAIFILLCTNYAFAYNEIVDFNFKYEIRMEDSIPNLNTIAKIINNHTKVDARNTALTRIVSQNYNNKDYGNGQGNVYINIPQSNEPCNYKTNQKFYLIEAESSPNYIDRYITIKLPQNTKKLEFSPNEFYIIYKDAIEFEGNRYDFKLELNSIACNFTEDNQIHFHVGYYKNNNGTYESQYFFPGVGISGATSDERRAEIDVTQTILDHDGNEVKVSGVFRLTDIDLYQGISLENVEINKDNVLMYKKSDDVNVGTDKIKYYERDIGTQDTASYIYSTTSENFGGNVGHVYVLLNDISKIKSSYTFGKKDAHSTVGFIKLNNYYKIETNVINGNISESIYNVDDGETKTINYRPKDDTYYLKRITVDGVNKTLEESIQDSYTFPEINQDHAIEVEYAKKLTVQFDSKGGTAVPSQSVIPGNKALLPAQPTKDGYKFINWYIDETYTTPYNFNNPVTEDKILYAKWEAIQPEEITHGINYVIIGLPDDNNANNPSKYTEGSTTPLTISSPTLDEYTFSGWFENVNLIGNPISTLDVSTRTSDITLYGKWTKNPEPITTAEYIVNHYLEDEDGTIQHDNKKYKLDETLTKNATINTQVTENSNIYAGYNAEDQSLTGTVLEDGSLTLDFYYDKIQYTVEFDSKGGTEVEDQTKNYGEKVDEPTNPTKEGYKFLYWYEIKDDKKVIYDFDKPVTSNKKLIAEWEEVKIIPDNPDDKSKDVIPTNNTDNTTAKKIIPNTGAASIAFISLGVLLIGAIFGIRFFKLRKDMK